MLDWWEISLRLVLAAIFGAIIGIERERKDWSAGMRTHMMVSMGACLIMLVSAYGFGDVLGGPNIRLDPSRIAAQIVSGIGFIGAGTILFLKPSTILGLTTASGLWTVAGIGMATGGGMYYAAGATTALALIILWGLQPLQRKFPAIFQEKALSIVADGRKNPQHVIDRLMEDTSLQFSTFTITKSGKKYIIELKIEKAKDTELAKILKELQREDFIKKITWKK